MNTCQPRQLLNYSYLPDLGGRSLAQAGTECGEENNSSSLSHALLILIPLSPGFSLGLNQVEELGSVA